nr:putative RNA-directed DNA polymerase, eukaryota, reverse transcriptase zinc-binding domain protein [Tanacetum cinerariifolium]
MASVVHNIVSEEQSAFISGRQNLDDPLMLSEIIDWYKNRKKKMMIFKVDFEKAYDSVNWTYLDYVLIQFGFGEKWRNRIQACLQSARTSILVNGSPTSEFSIKSGLRQGDLLSPFLFILIIEGLRIALKYANHSNLIKGVSVGNPGIRLSHFFYADDVVLVIKWNHEDMDDILRLFNVFFLTSSLHINVQKLNVNGVGVSAEEVEDMTRAIGCSSGSFSFTYLGFPIGVSMNRINHWQDMLDKFFWGVDQGTENMIWVKWENVLASLEKGGLGIGSLKAFNQAFLQKWRWRLNSNPKLLWVQVLKAIYGEDVGFAHLASSTKRVWENIVGSINQLHDCEIVPKDTLKYKVKCGTKVKFWIDT